LYVLTHLDGRPHGKKGELAVTVTPFFPDVKVQSVNNVYPIAILLGDDDYKTCKAFLKSIDEEIKQIKEAGVKVCDEQYSVKVLHVYDLSAFWKVCVGCKFGCPYCKLTREDEGWFVPPERDKKH
jgi:tRNA A37 methylthiotransferase MiaB